jgi:hypothetical protein
MVVSDEQDFSLRACVGFVCESDAVDGTVLPAFAYREDLHYVGVRCVQIEESVDDFAVIVIVSPIAKGVRNKTIRVRLVRA